MTTTTAIPTATPTATPTRRRFTVDEYHAMAHAGILTRDDRVELLDGDLILMPPIGGWHAARVNGFIKYLHPPLQNRVVFAVQNPARISDVSEPQPDVMLLRLRDDLYEDSHPKPEEVLLLVEVADTTVEYDRGSKLSAYARAGIPEVWIVTRKERPHRVLHRPLRRQILNRAPLQSRRNHRPPSLPRRFPPGKPTNSPLTHPFYPFPLDTTSVIPATPSVIPAKAGIHPSPLRSP